MILPEASIFIMTNVPRDAENFLLYSTLYIIHIFILFVHTRSLVQQT